jgi:hypothetical protein
MKNHSFLAPNHTKHIDKVRLICCDQVHSQWTNCCLCVHVINSDINTHNEVKLYVMNTKDISTCTIDKKHEAPEL